MVAVASSTLAEAETHFSANAVWMPRLLLLCHMFPVTADGLDAASGAGSEVGVGIFCQKRSDLRGSYHALCRSGSSLIHCLDVLSSALYDLSVPHGRSHRLFWPKLRVRRASHRGIRAGYRLRQRR
jgi:hypothetical protein